MEYFNAFLCGGILCLIGQLLIDKTPLTPAKILVLYVVTGVVLGGAGVYQKLVDWAGSGATVPPHRFRLSAGQGGAQGSGGAGLPGGPHRGVSPQRRAASPPPSSSASWWRCSSSPSPRADAPALGGSFPQSRIFLAFSPPVCYTGHEVINMELQFEPTRVYGLDGGGRLVAEITFPCTQPGIYTIDHTFVDPLPPGAGDGG